MSILVDRLSTLAYHSKASVLCLHHSSKSDSTISRGSSVLSAGMDSAWGLLEDEDDEDTIVLSCTKMRDGILLRSAPAFLPLPWGRKGVRSFLRACSFDRTVAAVVLAARPGQGRVHSPCCVTALLPAPSVSRRLSAVLLCGWFLSLLSH